MCVPGPRQDQGVLPTIKSDTSFVGTLLSGVLSFYFVVLVVVWEIFCNCAGEQLGTSAGSLMCMWSLEAKT